MEDEKEHNAVMGKSMIATVLVACGTEDGLNRFLVQLCNSNLSDVSCAFLVAFHCGHWNICRFDASPFEPQPANHRNITCHSASGSVDRLVVGDFPRSTSPQFLSLTRKHIWNKQQCSGKAIFTGVQLHCLIMEGMRQSVR